ncbi:hypothetical protein ABZ840_10280 [Streptomyces sp. NPDC047117]|uniref:hypothetical protein n=1 Tax=Streptomyces sp. NPDC047117 TaxID=3155379 RepID=UPI0033FBA7B8
MADRKQQYEQVYGKLQADVEGVRGRRDITPQAKRVAIARAYAQARDKLRAAQQADVDAYQSKRTGLERRLFGAEKATGTDAISRRDARDRAKKFEDPTEAIGAFKHAQRDGDSVLAQAIALHAAEMATSPVGRVDPKWQGVVSAYAESSPGKADIYRELTELRSPTTFAEAPYYSVMKPSELGVMKEPDIDRLAATDLDIGGVDPA